MQTELTHIIDTLYLINVNVLIIIGGHIIM